MDIDAYFLRIGYDGPRAPDLAFLAAIHRLHPAAIPFESLDPLLGRTLALDPASLEEKLVRGGRGGYCFEQNGLLLHVLSALGYGVTPLAARVRWTLPDEAPQTPLSHMLLKVTLGEGDFLCDVGFGGSSPTAPLRLAPGVEQHTPHGLYRLRPYPPGYELEMRLGEGWAALYRFTEEPQSARDYEMFNWYTATHPASRFVNNLIAARVVGDGRLALFNDEFARHHPDGRRDHRLLAEAAEAHRVLNEDFGLRVTAEDIARIWPRLPKREGGTQ